MANHCQARAGAGPAPQALGRGMCMAIIGTNPTPRKKRMRVKFGSTETTMFRVDKTMHRFGLKESRKRGLAKLPNWDEREWSAAQAARRAAELAYQVGSQTPGEVIFGDGENVYVLPYKDSVGKAEDDSRFVWMSSYDDSDTENAGYPQAVDAFGRDFGSHRHFGHVPKHLHMRIARPLAASQPRKRSRGLS